jgi:hypothetical protein
VFSITTPLPDDAVVLIVCYLSQSNIAAPLGTPDAACGSRRNKFGAPSMLDHIRRAWFAAPRGKSAGRVSGLFTNPGDTAPPATARAARLS